MFRVDQLLAVGGFGEVYLGWQPTMQRRVAIKVLRPEVAAERRALVLFEREARAAGNLVHPNVLPVFFFDFDDEAGLWFLVMQYIPGGRTLRDHIESAAGLAQDTAAVLALLDGIAGALDTAHAANIVHRDVKPANILLDERGRPILTDFGIAHLDSTGNTATTSRIGTAVYMAPEQWRGEVSDARVDQYALAIMTYEMLAGRPPFQGSPLSLMHQHLERQPPELLDFNKLLNPAVSAVVLKGMSKHPEQRFRSCGAFAEALRDAVRNEYVLDRRELRTDEMETKDASQSGGPDAETEEVGDTTAEGRDDPKQLDAGRTPPGNPGGAGVVPSGPPRSVQGVSKPEQKADPVQAAVARMGGAPVLMVGIAAVALVAWMATHWPPVPFLPSPPTQGVIYSGRVIDRETGRGVPNVYYLLLRPGATYEDWLVTDGLINDRVAASSVTDDRGAFRTTPQLERGKTYRRIIWAPIDYPRMQDNVTVASNAPDQMDLADIVISTRELAPVGSPTIVTPTRPPATPTPAAPTRAPATQTATRQTVELEISGRVVDSGTNQGVPGVRYLVLRPGATYQDWMNTPGVLNDLVIANGITDQDGVYRITAPLDRGETYLTIFATPDEYPTNMTDPLSVGFDTPNPLRLADVVIRRG
jgi:serine/threonine protein kinase